MTDLSRFTEEYKDKLRQRLVKELDALDNREFFFPENWRAILGVGEDATLEKLIAELDDMDEYDFLGSEGWRHFLGLEDLGV